MRNMNLWNIKNCTHGKLFNCDDILSKEISCVVSNSRRIRENCLFICIKGKNFDGHDFAEQVIEDGALAVISEVEFPDADFPYVLVESTFEATKEMAEFYRGQINAKVIGVTGSAGKTSTKEMIADILSTTYKVTRTKGNQNNEWGVPFTIFDIKEDDEMAVIEMGINHFGEMDRLARMARPDVVVITNIGLSHLEYLGDRNGVLEAKKEIFNYLPPYGMVILNGDDDKLATILNAKGIQPDFYGFGKGCDICAENYQSLGLDGCSFNMVFRTSGAKMTMNVHLKIPGEKMVYNALAATLVATKLKVAPLTIKKVLEKFKGVDGRNNIVKTERYTIVDGAYNASPTSVEAAVDVMASASGRRVLILGDMYELGEDSEKLHFQTGQYAGRSGVEVIICIGELSEKTVMGAKITSDSEVKYFKTVDACIEKLPFILEDGDVILVKASHAMGFDKIVAWLKSRKPAQ